MNTPTDCSASQTVDMNVAGQPAAAAPPQARRTAQPASKFRSLSDFRDGDEDEEEDESNEFYTGGEKSGQVCSYILPILPVTRPGQSHL